MNNLERQKEWKKEQRRLNTPYAQRQRESKRSEEAKERRRELRMRQESKEKERLYQVEYRKRPDVRAKARAREAAKYALVDGRIIRPLSCAKCGSEPPPLKDGRSGLRMDHHKGYKKEHWLDVIFICVTCDGNQLRREYE